MPYKDPGVARIKARDRKRRWRKKNRPADWTDPRGKHGNHAKGPDHPRWNKGKIVSSHGYTKVRVGRNHPLSDPNGYAYEHLVVWMSAGNELPNPTEVIHHKDGNKGNNTFANLEKKIRVEHSVGHHSSMTDKQVLDVRERYAGGENQVELAKAFNVPHQRISKIIRGLVRKSAGGPISSGDNRKRGVDGSFIGRKAAGRLLDGRTWDEMPE